MTKQQIIDRLFFEVNLHRKHLKEMAKDDALYSKHWSQEQQSAFIDGLTRAIEIINE